MQSQQKDIQPYSIPNPSFNQSQNASTRLINPYDTVLSKTDETTDTKLIDMIKEIKADEEDHKLLLKHYIETGEALTDEELKELKDKEAIEERLLGPSDEVIADSKAKGLYTEDDNAGAKAEIKKDLNIEPGSDEEAQLDSLFDEGNESSEEGLATDFKVGDVVTDIVDNDTAVIESISLTRRNEN